MSEYVISNEYEIKRVHGGCGCLEVCEQGFRGFFLCDHSYVLFIFALINLVFLQLLWGLGLPLTWTYLQLIRGLRGALQGRGRDFVRVEARLHFQVFQ